MDGPIDAMLRFLARVEPHDPEPRATPVGTIELRSGNARATFDLTGYVATALSEALAGYADPHEIQTAPAADPVSR